MCSCTFCMVLWCRMCMHTFCGFQCCLCTGSSITEEIHWKTMCSLSRAMTSPWKADPLRPLRRPEGHFAGLAVLLISVMTAKGTITWTSRQPKPRALPFWYGISTMLTYSFDCVCVCVCVCLCLCVADVVVLVCSHAFRNVTTWSHCILRLLYEYGVYSFRKLVE